MRLSSTIVKHLNSTAHRKDRLDDTRHVGFDAADSTLGDPAGPVIPLVQADGAYPPADLVQVDLVTFRAVSTVYRGGCSRERGSSSVAGTAARDARNSTGPWESQRKTSGNESTARNFC